MNFSCLVLTCVCPLVSVPTMCRSVYRGQRGHQIPWEWSHPTWVLGNSPCRLQGQQALSEPSSRRSTTFSLRQSLICPGRRPCFNLPPPVESWDYRHGVAILVGTFWGNGTPVFMLASQACDQPGYSISSCLSDWSCLVPCDWILCSMKYESSFCGRPFIEQGYFSYRPFSVHKTYELVST